MKHILLPGLLAFLLIGYLPAGFIVSLVDFTYGDKGLEPTYKMTALLLTAGWIVAGILFETAFRKGLLGCLKGRFAPTVAVGIHLLVLNVMFAIPMVHWGRRAEAVGLAGFIFYENLLQLFWTFLYMRYRSALATGIAHGLFSAFRIVLISDISGPFDSMFFYASSNSGFYILTFAMLMTAVGLAGASVLSRKWFVLRKG